MLLFTLLLLSMLAHVQAKRSQCPSGTGLIFYRNFDRVPDGAYTVKELKSEIPNVSMTAGNPRNIYAKDGALRMKLPRGCVGTGQCAYQWKVKLDRTLEAMYGYSVMFGSTYDFVKGGKLPGLCGNTCPTGGRDASNGFSARNMWRPGGKLVSYLYFHSKSESSGKDVLWMNKTTGEPIVMPRNQWIFLHFWVRLNTIGKRDGRLVGFYNGELAVNVSIDWRKSADIFIDTFYFSNFYGGKGDSWAPKQDMYISFNDLQVCTRDGFGWLAGYVPTTPPQTATNTSTWQQVEGDVAGEDVGETVPGLLSLCV